MTLWCPMLPRSIVNGIDVERQLHSPHWVERQHSVAISAQTEWLGSAQTRTLCPLGSDSRAATEFMVETDCSAELFGSGLAPSPLALLVASIGASFATAFVLEAAAANVRIESLVVRTDADIRVDASGERRFKDPSSGRVNLRASVEADAAQAHLDRLASLALQRSPIVALCRIHAQAQVTAVTRTTP